MFICIPRIPLFLSRNGTELKPIVKDQTYDFNYQEARLLSDEAVVQLGDELQIVCHYKSVGARNNFTSVSIISNILNYHVPK